MDVKRDRAVLCRCRRRKRRAQCWHRQTKRAAVERTHPHEPHHRDAEEEDAAVRYPHAGRGQPPAGWAMTLWSVVGRAGGAP